MLYREIIAVCSEIHTKHINALCGLNVELLNVKLAVHIVTTGLYNVANKTPSVQAVTSYKLQAHHITSHSTTTRRHIRCVPAF